MSQLKVMVLGIAQDAGYPQIGCEKKCCQAALLDPSKKEWVVSLAVMDTISKTWWLVEATPDLGDQLNFFSQQTQGEYSFFPEGIFITHAHIGHYTGLMYLGREAFNSNEIPVFTGTRMREFLSTNGPWDQLVKLKNIDLIGLQKDQKINEYLAVKCFLVPRRDEYSETYGFIFEDDQKRILFIPDIDKWERWETNIDSLIDRVDFAFLDATFFDGDELPGRDLNSIPHPFVIETKEAIKDRSLRKKTILIHFNHSNPLIFNESIKNATRKEGFLISKTGQTY